jgi:hypothetical protein
MSVIWKPTASHTVIPSSTVVAGEVVSLVFDAVNDLGEGQSPTNASVSLVDMQTREEIEGGATLDTPPIAGTQISIRITGVERQRTYELLIGFDHDPPRVEGEHTIRIHVIEGV